MSDKTEHPPLPEAFAALGVRNSILKGLADIGFTQPSEIQQLLIPRALAGVDILGQARTGTGKTAAFGIPVLCRVDRGGLTQCLILTPTRELAVQVSEDLRRYASHTPIKVIAVYGGQKIQGDIKALQGRPEVVVGTPGRVIDLLDRGLLKLNDIRFIVLDEVDRMLDIGFREDIRNILSRLKGMRRQAPGDKSKGQGFRETERDEVKALEADLFVDYTGTEGGNRAIDTGHSANGEDSAPKAHPPGHQTIFVSATFTEEIERLARRYMKEPVEKLIAPGADEKPTVDKVEQYYLSAEPWDKYKLLRLLLKREQPELAIIFCRTKHGAEKLAKNLHHDGISCREIHGNLAQNKRDSVMKGFKGGKFDVLVATDLASRGIDVSGITHIINYDVPEDPDIYVHRIGRTARMGAGGKAYMFVTREQGDELTRIENTINMVIPVDTVEGFVPRPPPERAPMFPPNPNSASGTGPGGQPGATAAAAPDKPAEPDKNSMRLGAKLPSRRRRR
ncbi:MAG TPA: DEAD/DEAH box helicase [Tepidisphaeraceae bacterium]|jgi:superfamily II DNA/RNA helicase